MQELVDFPKEVNPAFIKRIPVKRLGYLSTMILKVRWILFSAASTISLVRITRISALSKLDVDFICFKVVIKGSQTVDAIRTIR
jgi:hypothetical protein